MKRSVNDIINLARRQAGKSRIDNPLEDQSAEGKDSRLVYEQSFESLLSIAPWRFATKRLKLERTNDTPVDSYRYTFNIPQNGLFLWDIYNKYDYSLNQVDYYSGQSYAYYIFPLATGTKFLSNKAELIGNQIASNYYELSVLYTLDRKYSLTEVTRQFVDHLILDMEESFIKMKDTDEEKVQARKRSNDSTRSKRISQAGRENRKAYNKRNPEIIERMNSSFL